MNMRDGENSSWSRLRIRVEIEWIGDEFLGWQRQCEGSRSVQGEMEIALESVIHKRLGRCGDLSDEMKDSIRQWKFSVLSAGRTDAGVHALCMVAHFDVPDIFPEIWKLENSLNQSLPADIRVSNLSVVPLEFHAQKNVVSRSYMYRIVSKNSLFHRNRAYFFKQHLNVKSLQTTANLFIGTFDFSWLSTKPSHTSPTTIFSFSVFSASSETIEISVRGSSFHYHQVRIMVGVLIDVEIGNLTQSDLIKLMHQETRNQITYNLPLTPPWGLYFQGVQYLDQ